MKVLKKILIAFMLLLTISLVACDNASTGDFVEKAYVDNQINEIKLENAMLREIIDSMIEADRVNGQLVDYEAFLNNEMAETTQTSEGNFDDVIAPDYMKNEAGEYITFDELALMLREKYFGDNEGAYPQGGSDLYQMIPYASMTFVFKNDTLDINEATARLILMVEELVQYTYYALSSNGINILIVYNNNGYSQQIHFQIPKIIITNGIFTINYDSLMSNEFESYIYSPNGIFENSVKQYYDEFVLNGTYDGYVLNYVE